MKNEKPPFKGFHGYYAEALTKRQWAKKGMLPKENEEGKMIFSNRYRVEEFEYFLPEQVNPATKDELDEYWAPERRRNNERRKEQRRKEALSY